MSDRYLRQTPLIGLDGQNKLKNSVVLVIGCGGIGNSLLVNLVAMGVGKVIFYDDDIVSNSNLHRQILFNEEDVGKNKVDVIYKLLLEKNAEVVLESVGEKFKNEKGYDHVIEADLVIDASDNYETMYFVNDVCAYYGKKLISSSILKYSIQISSFDTRISCYRCLFPYPPPAGLIPGCIEGGVLGGVAGSAGSLVSVMAINLLLDTRDDILQKIILFSVEDFSIKKLPVVKNKNCPACVEKNIEINIFDNYGVTLAQIKNSNYFLVDVRGVRERNSNHLDDDAHIPLENIKSNNIIKNKKVVFYCGTNKRSKMAMRICRDKGLDAYFLIGGINECLKK